MGISKHPKCPERFPLGCALCRSEKLSVLVKESNSAGFNLEKRDDMMAKHGGINNLEERDKFIRGRRQTIE